jgi:pimeloyl-ACP methyl ester carboxylesterase
MGGMVALEIVARQALQAPGGRGGGRVDGLVLACTTAAFGRPGGAWQAQFVAERLAPLEAGLGMAGMARLLVPGLVSPAAPPRVRDLAVEVMSAVPEATYRAALRAIADFDRREALAAIGVPTLVLSAADDRTATPQVMERMAARIAGSEFVCLGGAGHIAPLEDPQAFNGAVVEFLRRRFDPAFRR